MSLQVTVVAAEHAVWSGEARRVVAKTTEGEIGILPGHEPVLGIVAGGQVRIVTADGEHLTAQADGGFLSVENDRVTVVADQAELV
ncbi:MULTISPECIES: F0F1 ATP synthase subunit epsilon [Brevibacterium]|uniref:ATP synthase epsilon chain n=1 Tax=Brevibacterium pityocampae TaxID=506594 RepID=A0ABP8JGD2_9MICO|nr:MULTISPECIES: F0F1 ATP synthase subunit epsilon [Actinomycetes]MCK1802783.1 F0F1 ATP synthase subunit epsilon [Brevibacterium sp. R8603A2]MCX0276310.1 F0F1 ATP synthase subunit epsilon [Nocardia zapadnayensis]QCP05480.1 F0F1 ATP synthase subunit epsilon [Brevibacterium sp. CS2]